VPAEPWALLWRPVQHPTAYTMLVGYTGLTYAPLIYPKAGFDLARDFAPISAIDACRRCWRSIRSASMS